MFVSAYNNLEFSVLIVLLVCWLFFIVQLIYSIYFFRKLIFFKRKKSNYKPNVSVIICAKNEFDNLKKNLKSILNQDYINYEVIVVNDQSNDKTADLLKEYEKTFFRLKVVNIDEHVNHIVGKKFALTLGIKTAKYDYVLLTDADCFVDSKKWISSMVSNFKSSDIVLGFGGYVKDKSILNKLIRFDTFLVAIQYFSYALKSMTYMGVGRNLAYKKELFFNNKGFASHMGISSGDDDLFIREVAKKSKVSIELSEKSHTLSNAKDSWKEWYSQKRRHLSTSPFYDNKIKFLLAFFSISQLIFLSALLFLIIKKTSYFVWGPLILLKLLLVFLTNYPLMKKLNCMDLLIFSPLFEVINLLMQGSLFIFSINHSHNKW